MAAPRSRFSPSPPIRDSDDSFSESENVDGTAGWDALEWTKIEHDSRSENNDTPEFLLEAEEIIAEGYGVVLVNTDEAGVVVVTNFRLIFLSEGTRNIISLGTIPLATIEKFSKQVMKIPSSTRQLDKTPSRRILQVTGKDMRVIVFGFRPRTKQRRVVFDALLRCTRPVLLWDLYAFTCGPSKYYNGNPKVRLLNEYIRLLGKSSYYASNETFDDDTLSVSNEWWRTSGINSNYKMCPTYPFFLIVPKCISDEEVLQASAFRARCRLPVISWCHPGNGAVIARSSQPLVGLMMNTRSYADEKLVASLCSQSTCSKGSKRKVYIADARPRKNALANSAMGGGSESSSNYMQSEIVFFGIDNIHGMRDSLTRFREYVDTHGATSSDGRSSFLRDGGWSWGGGNLSSMSASVSTLGDSGWLIHIQSILAGSAWIAARVALESSSVLVHCSDGWDRTTQLVSLASLLLDPYYRTFTGFQALVEKDWLAFGHPFADRMGMPTIPGSSNVPLESLRQASCGNIPSSPVHNIPSSPMRSSSSAPPTAQASSSSHAQTTSHYSPIFLQWVDCISQLLRMYPFAFEFSLVFLVDFLDCMLSCRFGNFLCNSEKERQQSGVSDSCGCLWAYLADLRASEGSDHAHYNFFYDPMKHEGPLLPPAAALAPTIWPQFHLRWGCPSEAQAGELEAQCRIMAKELSEMQKAKEMAEEKAKDIRTSMEALTVEIQNEKQLSTSATKLAKSACKESAAIKRVVQSLGCKIHSSNSGDCTLDTEGSTLDMQQKWYTPKRNSDDNSLLEDEPDLSISISVMTADTISDGQISRTSGSFCPLSIRDGGGCNWPNGGCVQLANQFTGLKANFDAFDQLSIDDCYFEL